jgi:hypothetical protein
MNSLKEVYGALSEVDHVKEAQAEASEQYGADFSDVNPELIKQAQDYDYIGRVLAHHVMADLVKEAVDEEAPEASEDEKKKQLAAIMAKARGEGGGEEKDDEKKDDEEEEGEESEKKASIKAAILERMSHDPDYVSHLIAKHYPG